MFVKHNKPFYAPEGQPQAGDPSANPQPQAGDPPANPQAGNEPPKPARTPAEYEGEIAALRRESASHRTKLTAFEKAEADRQAATLSEQQKLEKRAADAEAQAAQQAKALQEMRVTLAIERNAAKLNIIDPEAAVKLLDTSLIEVDEHGQPKNIEALLEALVKNKPYLVAQAGTPKPASSGGASNPPRASSGAGGLTKEVIERMTPAEYRARQAEIHAWLRQQK